MKTLKNLLLVIFVSVCSFLFVGVLDVSASIGFANDTPVCSPNENLKPGGKTTCYIRGKGNQSNGGGVHGFVTRLYTTDGLIFDSVQPYIDNTSAVAYEASANSDKQETITLSDNSTTISFKCTFDATLKAPKADWQIGQGDPYRCALFYSNTKEGKITVNNGAPKSDIQKLTGTGNGIMVIGKVIAHIDENVDANSSCGELCVFTKEANDTSSYKLEGSDDYFCTEVHYTTGKPPAGPPTGAFASYAILAAGALIAVSAVAIAKKHNKIYRV